MCTTWYVLGHIIDSSTRIHILEINIGFMH